MIQVFVEALDKCFENVCELDLIFHSDRVNYILDEIIMAGMVLETNIHQILLAVTEQNRLHTQSLKTNTSTSIGGGSGGGSGGYYGGNGSSGSSSGGGGGISEISEKILSSFSSSFSTR